MLQSQQVVRHNKMDYACTAVRFAMDELRVSTLKDKQKEAIHNFVRGRDCFVCFNGYGA